MLKSTHIGAQTIILAEIGSTAWGLNLEDSGDQDLMGICIEGLDQAMTFSPFEQEVYRTAAMRTGRQDAPSEPGDIDQTIYSLRKWLRLALKGNPTILTLLYARGKALIARDSRGAHLQELAPRIVSRQAGKAFLGYLQAQRMRMLGERGGLDVHQKELEAKYGYDPKYAMHMLRLGMQGVELLQTGSISIPMQEDQRQHLLAVRKGQFKRQDVLTECGELQQELKDLLDSSPLPEEPDKDFMKEWMLETYWSTWRALYHVKEMTGEGHLFR